MIALQHANERLPSILVSADLWHSFKLICLRVMATPTSPDSIFVFIIDAKGYSEQYLYYAKYLGLSTLDTLQCASESGFRTSSLRSALMRIDALWSVYTTEFAHNGRKELRALRSCPVCDGNGIPSSYFTEKESATRTARQAVQEHELTKRSGYLRSAVENIRLCACVRLPACQRR